MNVKKIQIPEPKFEYVITRHGRPVAVLLNFDEYDSLIETLNVLRDDDTVAAINEARPELSS